jgi:DMSO/TMAO reductase YedYZ molybdopterin-dependent catalytic subunit
VKGQLFTTAAGNLHIRIEVEKRDFPTAGEVTGEGLVVVREEPPNLEVTDGQLVAPVTHEPYVRTNFEVPHIGPRHRVRVAGAVERPISFDLHELAELPQREVIMTLECAGNDRSSMTPLPEGLPWGGNAVSTVAFRGVPLAEVLERARLQPDAIAIVAEGADHGVPEGGVHEVTFARALPREKALHPDTLLALEMNGAPLPPEHGAPVRLVVPGWYGVASVKWLTQIEARTSEFEGWFQSDRYIYDYADDLPAEPVAELRPRARIVEPAAHARLQRGPQRIVGWAWAGAGLERVEVSIDGGDWQRAAFDAPLSRWAWRRFELAWHAHELGRHSLRARAIDRRGEVQPEWSRFNKFGYGNNAVQNVLVTVV